MPKPEILYRLTQILQLSNGDMRDALDEFIDQLEKKLECDPIILQIKKIVNNKIVPEDLVMELNKEQQSNRFHPLTCNDCGEALIATIKQWTCDCGFTQDYEPMHFYPVIRTYFK